MEGEAQPARHRTRIEDVAAAAGVSVATVSRALRNLPNVAETTRRRVIEIAAELNYRADPAAARLAAGMTRTITVVVPHLSSWYFSTVIAGAEAVCNEAGYECLVLGVGTFEQCNLLLDEHSHFERRTDGLILVNIPATAEQAKSLRERRVRLVTIGTHTPGCASVSIDDEHTGRLATSHLVDLGHRRVALISGQSDDPMNFDVPRRRRAGYIAALTEAGVEPEDSLMVSGNFGIDGGQEAMAALLALDDPPTAVFAMSDEMAFGALLELSERNLRAGVDVSVIGVDDHDVARVLRLTTVRQHVADHGSSAARALLAQLQDPGAPVTDVESPVELVVRSTTGPGPRRTA